jgi:nucleoside-diphosphate-sugar epimerase
VVTVRSEEKGQRIVKSTYEALGKQISFVVVEDVAADGAFDKARPSSPVRTISSDTNQAVKSDPPFDYVVHTASPYQLHFDDPVKDCLDPAIKGTASILEAAHVRAPAIKRVVITSSSAAVLNPPNHPKVYDESSWSDVTWEQAKDPKHTYRASKVTTNFRSPDRQPGTKSRHGVTDNPAQKFAEQKAWTFQASWHSRFTLATINNTYTFGPVSRSLASLDSLNTSNHRIRDLVQGRMREGIHPTAPVFTFVDVRDVALAHVRALTVPEAGGKRFYVVGGYFSNPRLAGIIRRRFPELEAEGRLPPEGEDDFPEDHWGFDNSRSREVLGLEYRGLEESVVDTVESILRFEREQDGEEERRC